MPLLESLTSTFIDTFGITQPTEQSRRRASWFIMTLLVLVLTLIAGVGLMLYHLLHV